MPTIAQETDDSILMVIWILHYCTHRHDWRGWALTEVCSLQALLLYIRYLEYFKLYLAKIGLCVLCNDSFLARVLADFFP